MNTNNTVNPKLRKDTIQVVVGSAQGNEIAFGDLRNIADAARIMRIEAFNDSQVSFTQEGTPVVDLATFNKSYLVLQDSKGTVFQTLPLSHLTKAVNGTTIEPVNLGPIDPAKCIVKVATGQAPPLGKAYLFLITYEKK